MGARVTPKVAGVLKDFWNQLQLAGVPREGSSSWVETFRRGRSGVPMVSGEALTDYFFQGINHLICLLMGHAGENRQADVPCAQVF